MHDSITCEQLGVPALAIVTDEFVDAAEYTLACLGAADYEFCAIGHPISSAGEEVLAAGVQSIMDSSLERIILGNQA